MDEISKSAKALELQKDLVYDRKETHLETFAREYIFAIVLLCIFGLGAVLLSQPRFLEKGPPPTDVEQQQTQTYERTIEITPTFSQ